MTSSERTLLFFHNIKRLKAIDWDKFSDKLTSYEFAVLSTIKLYNDKHPDITGLYVSDFASKLKIPLPTASKLLRHLEHKNLIERKVNTFNRRKTFIMLTAYGEQACQQEKENWSKLSQYIEDNLGNDECERFIGTIGKILNLLENYQH